MNRATRPQKDKINQFRTITGASDKVATECLKATGWLVDAGIDHFYQRGLQTTTVDPKGLETLFRRYKEPNEDIISLDGVTTFCEDLGVDPTDIALLVISYHMNAETMCEFTREEFTSGLLKLGADSVEKLQRKLPELRAEMRDPAKFKDIYEYAFQFSREKGQKCLQLDTATAMWQLLFSEERRWEYVDEWCEFLQKHHNRAISKDTWTQLLEYTRSVKPDFSNFDESSAWPYLIDEFTEQMRAKLAAPAG